MASIVPIALQAISLAQTATTIAGVFNNNDKRSDNLALQQLQQKQLLQQTQSAQDAALSRQDILANAELAEEKRRSTLKRAIARQRARFGGNGVASGDGSSEAVLLGFFEESDAEKKLREQLDNLRLQSLDQNLLQQQRINTLTRTQTAERNKLERASNTLSDVGTTLSGVGKIVGLLDKD